MRRTRTRALAALLALTVVVSLVADSCGSSGRELSPPVDGAVGPTRSTAAAASPVSASGPLQLSSPAFSPGGPIPGTYACEGPSPELAWSGALPDGTVELALVLRDPQADGFVHWFVAGISAGATRSPTNGTPENVAQLPNSAGKPGYSGPCPPPGEHHTYEFSILALSSPATIPPTTPIKDAWEQIQGKVVGRATLVGTYDGSADVSSPGTAVG